MDMNSLLFCIASFMVISVYSKKDKQLYCGVCRAMVDELDFNIKEVDPKKTIHAGSYRLDTDGNLDISEKPYARSDTHLTELMEAICPRLNDYAKTTDARGQTSVIRTDSRIGRVLSLKNIIIDRSFQKKIIFYCDTIIEDHEDDLISLFKRENLPLPSLEKVVCADIVEACTGEDLSVPLPVAGYAEEQDSYEDTDEDEENNKDEL